MMDEWVNKRSDWGVKKQLGRRTDRYKWSYK